jgi:hypothetical protein
VTVYSSRVRGFRPIAPRLAIPSRLASRR